MGKNGYKMILINAFFRFAIQSMDLELKEMIN